MSQQHRNALIAVAATSAVLVALAGCASSSDSATDASTGVPTFVIGFPADLTGSNASYDVDAKQGADLAVSQINAQGKVHLVVDPVDTQSDQQQSVIAVQNLINDKHVDALDMDFGSDSVQAAAPVAVQAGVPSVVAVSQATGLEKIGPEVLRTAPSEPAIDPILASYAKSCLNVSTVAALYDRTDTQPVDSTKATLNAMTKQGINVVDQVTVSTTQDNISPQASLVVLKHPDAVVINALGTYELQIIRALRSAGLPGTVPILSGEDMSTSIIKQVGGALQTGAAVTAYSPDQSNAANKAFVTAYRAKYNADPDYLAAQSYDSMYYLVQAYQKAGIKGSDSVTQIRQKLLSSARSIRTFSGVEGTYTFPAPVAKQGMAQPTVAGVVLVVHDGAVTKTLSPGAC